MGQGIREKEISPKPARAPRRPQCDNLRTRKGWIVRHRLGPFLSAVAGALCLAASLWAQYPTQYPPGQYPPTYPPGQYPPNTYPPNTYPPNTYPGGGYPPNTYPPNTVPVRLPGGIPVGVPVPEAKIPKKDSKPEEVKTTLSSVDGTLRKLGEKELVLGVRKNLLRFRLLAKTEFLDPKGAVVRDSLVHPGDQLSVQVSPDDPETALRVIVMRGGTADERTAADHPFDPDTVRAPRAEDLSKPRTVTTHEATRTPAETSDAETEPAGGIRNAAPAEPAGPPAEAAPPSPDLRPRTDDAILSDARAESATFSASLPNYLVQQVTSRYFANGLPAQWREIDVVTAELAYVNGTEDYRDFRINGEPIRRPIESTGSWSTGEFGTTLEDVMSPATNASFRRRGEEKLAGRPAYVFDYTVAQPNSHWIMVAADRREYKPAYEGAVWIDAATRRVLRIEQRTTGMPRDFTISRAEAVLEYGFAKIEGKTYLLPAKGETNGCMSGSGTCTRNVIEFRNYRKFTADSTVTFGK